jgi:hypothetical protein
MSATSTTFDLWVVAPACTWNNKIYRKNPEHLAPFTSSGEKKKSRREAIKTESLRWNYANCAQLYHTVRAPTALPARQGAPMAADGMNFAERDSIFRRTTTKEWRMEVDPTLADEEQLDEDISSKEADSPDLGICNESSRSPTVVPAAAPPARRGSRVQVANCSNPATCPGDLTVGCQSLPEAERTQRTSSSGN